MATPRNGGTSCLGCDEADGAAHGVERIGAACDSKRKRRFPTRAAFGMVGPCMPLEHDDLRSLVAAQGYLELGMFLDANAELNEIAPERRHLPEILEVRMHIFCALKKWELMQTVAKKLALSDPENVRWTALMGLRNPSCGLHRGRQAHPDQRRRAAGGRSPVSFQLGVLRVPARKSGWGERATQPGLRTQSQIPLAGSRRLRLGAAVGDDADKLALSAVLDSQS